MSTVEVILLVGGIVSSILAGADVVRSGGSNLTADGLLVLGICIVASILL